MNLGNQETLVRIGFWIGWRIARFTSHLWRQLFRIIQHDTNLVYDNRSYKNRLLLISSGTDISGEKIYQDLIRNNSSKTIQLPKERIKSIHEVVIDLQSAVMYDSSKKMVQGYSSWPNEYLKTNRLPSAAFPRFIIPRVRDSEKVVAFPSTSYYHFLIEDLPNFLHLRESLSGFLLVARKRIPKYAKDVADILELELKQVDEMIKVEESIYVKRNLISGWPDPIDLQKLKIEFEELLFSGKPHLKVYVSRRKSSRSPKFEKELEGILEHNGWIVVNAQDLDFKAQVSIFSRSRILMGMHGAGLANAVWLRSGAKVIELRFKNQSLALQRISKIQAYHHIMHELNPKTSDKENLDSVVNLLQETRT